MNCKKCQKEIDDSSKFCEFCGNKLTTDYKDIIDQILKEKPLSEIEQLNKKMWYRLLKVFYFIGIIYGVGASLIIATDSKDIRLLFVQLLLIFFISEITKRSFYYIYLGKIFPKKQ